MKRILITDTHYGVKNNSTTWLKSQVGFIYDQLIPYIKDLHEDVYLYHLGDMFDSRSSINPLIADEVKKAFIQLSNICKQMYIIGGNHDYYSPNDDTVDSIDIVFHDNCDGFRGTIVTHDLLVVDNRDLLIPWYEYDKIDKIKEVLKNSPIENIFCHTDLIHIDDEHKELFKGYKIYSGHIHTPSFYKNYYTLGSTYALTFADCNSERGFYVLDDINELTFIPNTRSIKFWRFNGDEIFNFKVSENDYVEAYVSQDNLLIPKYIERIKEINTTYHNKAIIPVDSTPINEDSVDDFDQYNIKDICRENIPDNLLAKFDYMNDLLKLN